MDKIDNLFDPDWNERWEEEKKNLTPQEKAVREKLFQESLERAKQFKNRPSFKELGYESQDEQYA